MIDLQISFTDQASAADVTFKLIEENQALTGAEARAAEAARFSGKSGQVCDILGAETGRLILLGLGEVKKASKLDMEKLGAKAWTLAGSSGAKQRGGGGWRAAHRTNGRRLCHGPALTRLSI